MRLHHIAIWTFRLEEMKEFYVRYFHGESNEKYINPRKKFESYFISFENGISIELMSRADVQNTPIEENRLGLTHFAFTFSSPEQVLQFTEQLRSEGYPIAGEPRTSGDGYFESVVLDPDGNRIECVYSPVTIPNKEIDTERLLLRPFRDSDAEAFFACCRNPKLGDNAGWKPHETLEESREILHTVFIGYNAWAIILKETDELVGCVGLVPDPKRENPLVNMLGYWLNEPFWGKGYMSEAVQAVSRYGFEELGLSLITANCYPHNERSQHVLKRNGFLYEGVLRQAEVTYDGHIYDHQCYYLLPVTQPTAEDHEEILQLWEASVRHTHHFLTEEDIQFYKPLIQNQYLKSVDLYVCKDIHGRIAAFMGLSDELIEMLFVHPDQQAQGYGKRLVEYAGKEKSIRQVDVNEQNEKALQFYLHLGFHVVGRDDTDGAGKPFPILHLKR